MKVFDEKKEGCNAGELVIRGRDALPFFAAVLFGLVCHGFILTNKKHRRLFFRTGIETETLL